MNGTQPWEDLLLKELSLCSTMLVTGPTGCGKSSRVAPLLVKMYPSNRVLLIQPRRMVTEKLYSYIAQTNGWTNSDIIGFIMGRKYFMQPSNRLVLATTGSAYNMLVSSPDYFDFVIIDEIHERSALNDAIMGLCRRLQAIYNFKLILMSATVMSHTFLSSFSSARHFVMATPQSSSYTIVERSLDKSFNVTGKSPAKIAPLTASCVNRALAEKYDKNLMFSITGQQIEIVATICLSIIHNTADNTLPGDILVFVPGMGDFERLIRELKRKKNYYRLPDKPSYSIVLLHSLFSEEYMHTVDDASTGPRKKRERIVFISTNICETSLTLQSISYVVDSCLTRKRSSEPDRPGLITTFASQEAMMQRRGRVGRVADGIYFMALKGAVARLLPLAYAIEPQLSSVGQYILSYYGSQVFRNAEDGHLIDSPSGTAPTPPRLSLIDMLVTDGVGITPSDIDTTIYKLLDDRILVQVGQPAPLAKDSHKQSHAIDYDGLAISTLGLIQFAGNYEKNMSGLSWGIFLGIPYTALSLFSVEQTSFFVHELELLLHKKQYLPSAINEDTMLLLSSFPLPKLRQYIMGAGKNQDIDIPTLCDTKQPSDASLAAITLSSLTFDVDATSLGSCYVRGDFDERLAAVHILGMWRILFPVPTESPCRLELEWCRKRHIAPSLLREAELEIISMRVKLSNHGLVSALSFVEANMLGAVYPATAKQLDAEYNTFTRTAGLSKATLGPYLSKAAELKKKFSCNYTPTVCNALLEEQALGPCNLCRLVGLSNALSNPFGCYITNSYEDNVSIPVFVRKYHKRIDVPRYLADATELSTVVLPDSLSNTKDMTLQELLPFLDVLAFLRNLFNTILRLSKSSTNKNVVVLSKLLRPLAEASIREVTCDSDTILHISFQFQQDLNSGDRYAVLQMYAFVVTRLAQVLERLDDVFDQSLDVLSIIADNLGREAVDVVTVSDADKQKIFDYMRLAILNSFYGNLAKLFGNRTFKMIPTTLYNDMLMAKEDNASDDAVTVSTEAPEALEKLTSEDTSVVSTAVSIPLSGALASCSTLQATVYSRLSSTSIGINSMGYRTSTHLFFHSQSMVCGPVRKNNIDSPSILENGFAAWILSAVFGLQGTSINLIRDSASAWSHIFLETPNTVLLALALDTPEKRSFVYCILLCLRDIAKALSQYLASLADASLYSSSGCHYLDTSLLDVLISNDIPDPSSVNYDDGDIKQFSALQVDLTLYTVFKTKLTALGELSKSLQGACLAFLEAARIDCAYPAHEELMLATMGVWTFDPALLVRSKQATLYPFCVLPAKMRQTSLT